LDKPEKLKGSQWSFLADLMPGKLITRSKQPRPPCGGRSRQLVSAGSARVALSAAAHEVLLIKRARFVHGKRSAPQFGSVELRDRFFSIVVVHFHESESPGPAGVSVRDNADRLDLSGLCEQALEIVFRRLKRQISYV
jgi:hypothetical protein